jgi:hypothetical protein
VFASRNFCSSEAGPDLERFRSWDGKHSMSECGFELVKDRFTQARGNVTDDAGHGSPNRVLGVLCPDDPLHINGEYLENQIGQGRSTSVIRFDVSG